MSKIETDKVFCKKWGLGYYIGYEIGDKNYSRCMCAIASLLSNISVNAVMYMDYYGYGQRINPQSFLMQYKDRGNSLRKKYWLDTTALCSSLKIVEDALEDGRYFILYVCSKKITWEMFCKLRPGERNINNSDENVFAVFSTDGVETGISIHNHFTDQVRNLMKTHSENGLEIIIPHTF